MMRAAALAGLLALAGCGAPSCSLIQVETPPWGTFVERCAYGDDAACRYVQLTPEEAAALRRPRAASESEF